VAVVTSLLSVGEAVLTEARDKDLLGGGDVILLPVGIDVESLKVGGVTSLFYKIPGFRFLVRSVLESSRVTPYLAAVSPRFAGEQLYLRAHGRVTPVIGLGTVPSRERAVLPGYSWPDSIRDTEADRRLLAPTAEERLCDTDHFHAPPLRAAELGWAEWHYFEIYDPATTRFAYLSFQVFGDWAHGKGIGAVAVQLGRAGATSGRALHAVPGAEVRASLSRPDLAIGDTQVQLEGTEYHVQFHDAEVSGDIRFTPDLRQSFAAGELRGDSGFVSGYAVAFLKARARGEIRSPQGDWKFEQAVGYHDHNWGGWKNVSWNWGKAAGDSLSLLYGQVQAGASRQPGFAALFSPEGLLGIFRPESVQVLYDGSRVRPVPGGEAPLPRSVRLRASAGERDSLAADIDIRDGVATSIPENRDFRPRSLLSARRAFLQMRGDYHVRAILDGVPRGMRSPGPAETYAPIRRPQGRPGANGN
jgi:hypothetical protein